MGGLREGNGIRFFQGAHGDGEGFPGSEGDDSGPKKDANCCLQGTANAMF